MLHERSLEARTAGWLRNRLRKRQFPVFACPEEARTPPHGLALDAKAPVHNVAPRMRF